MLLHLSLPLAVMVVVVVVVVVVVEVVEAHDVNSAIAIKSDR